MAGTGDGRHWIRVALNAAEPANLEAALIRWVRSRRAGAKTDRHPVVSLPLCIDGVKSAAAFTLTDRTGLD